MVTREKKTSYNCNLILETFNEVEEKKILESGLFLIFLVFIQQER